MLQEKILYNIEFMIKSLMKAENKKKYCSSINQKYHGGHLALSVSSTLISAALARFLSGGLLVTGI